MADLERNITQLRQILADNIVGDVSPQNIRDFLESLMSGWGYIGADAYSWTLPGSAGEPTWTTLLDGGGALDQEGRGTVSASGYSGKLTFSLTGLYLVVASFAVEFPFSVAAVDYQFGLSQNGAVPSVSKRLLFPSAADPRDIILFDLVRLSPGHTIELQGVQDNASDKTVTVTGQLFAKRVGALVESEE